MMGTLNEEASGHGNGTDVQAPKPPIELYMVKLNPPSRAVWLYLLQHDIPHVLIEVDFINKQKTPEFITKFPHKEVPILVDDSLIIFEGPAILRYLATQYTNFSTYGSALQTRMTVESLLSWANSELHRVVGFCYAYPHFLEQYQLKHEEGNEALVEHGIKSLTKHLENLESEYLANKKYLTGDRVTVADSYVATILLQAEWVGFSFRMWPRVQHWLRRVQMQDDWEEVHKSHKELVNEMDCSMLD